jgi:hypothetical protein
MSDLKILPIILRAVCMEPLAQRHCCDLNAVIVTGSTDGQPTEGWTPAATP